MLSPGGDKFGELMGTIGKETNEKTKDDIRKQIYLEFKDELKKEILMEFKEQTGDLLDSKIDQKFESREQAGLDTQG